MHSRQGALLDTKFGLTKQAEAFQLGAQDIAGNTQALGSTHLITAAMREGRNHQGALEFLGDIRLFAIEKVTDQDFQALTLGNP